MKDIKFRAFDDKSNTMVQITEIKIINGKISGSDAWVESSGNLIFAPSGKRYEDLMQFTGLHDKNGVEIYEGDILHYRGHFYETRHNILNRGEQIRYDIDGNYPVKFWDNVGFQMYHQGIGFYKIHSIDVEVIGNIHETPELLEQS